MKTNVQRTLRLGIALCLGLTAACVKVDVSITSQDAKFSQWDNRWISLAELKKLHTQRTCNPSSLNVVKELQETNAWCWAASTRMVMEYQNRKHNQQTDLQCHIVRKILLPSSNEAICCDNDPSVQCIQGNWPDRVLDYYQFNYRMVKGTLDDWNALTGEICSVGPFISVVEWSGGGRHTFVVKGYHEEPQIDAQLRQVVEVYDPLLDDPQDIAFDDFDSSPEFSHDRAYVQILPKPKGQP